jgi:branched-chain amino acid transport system substrate-binding protein
MVAVEAIRIALSRAGGARITGEDVRWALEHLDLTEARLAELGIKDFMHPLRISCADHEGSGPVMFQQWDGTKWKIVSGWVPVMRDVVRPKLEAAAFEEGKLLGSAMRDC